MTPEKLTLPPLELWAGVECTVNRVGDQYSDQLERSGHDVRASDLERLASLGVRTLRYPILWERTAPQALDLLQWSWADERMELFRRLDLKPIVGLVHHGSGPRYTSLVDPEFPEKLAVFAGAVARRFPWITDYTPINEPLTTARFSCLYGHWYPHHRDALSFVRALLLQGRAIVLSMRAIREVNPSARLVQTEDLGKTFSTRTLAYQAEFENDRRWLTFDLLCGRIVPDTPMWDYFSWLGVQASELEWFIENQTSPDLLGINHYVTSERFLDERITRYPTSSHGGNGRHTYADVEAVRVCAEGIAGPKAIMKEAWKRYHLPLAITEAHLGCTREEQLRWLNEVWTAALESREEDIDVRAVTAWAAFGTYDWNTLLTSIRGCYEPGIFDLRSPAPRETALASLIRELLSGKAASHPTIDAPGWWHRLERICYTPVSRREASVSSSVRPVKRSGEVSRPLLITGGNGTLGQALGRICGKRGLAYHLLPRENLDIADQSSVAAAMDQFSPWAIINAAGYVRVDHAERETEICYRENVTGPTNLARECANRKVQFVTFSSDLVFDGAKCVPYVESDIPAPLNVYGLSKAAAEEQVLDVLPETLVIRTSAFFGPWDAQNFVYGVLTHLSEGRPVFAATDIHISPTYLPDLVNATLDLLIDGEHGIWHLTNPSVITWAELALRVAEKAGFDLAKVECCPGVSMGFLAGRPAFTALASERGDFMPPLEDSLESFFREGVANNKVGLFQSKTKLIGSAENR
jgi:dTDP-4-dehydrorhamnose reductase